MEVFTMSRSLSPLILLLPFVLACTDAGPTARAELYGFVGVTDEPAWARTYEGPAANADAFARSVADELQGRQSLEDAEQWFVLRDAGGNVTQAPLVALDLLEIDARIDAISADHGFYVVEDQLGRVRQEAISLYCNYPQNQDSCECNPKNCPVGGGGGSCHASCDSFACLYCWHSWWGSHVCFAPYQQYVCDACMWSCYF
jgi:hypothetical protein